MKPDLIPSWDEQLRYLSATSPQQAALPYNCYSTVYRSPLPVYAAPPPSILSPSGPIPPPPPPILSSAHKVLYENSPEGRRRHDSSLQSSPRLETFSSNTLPRKQFTLEDLKPNTMNSHYSHDRASRVNSETML